MKRGFTLIELLVVVAIIALLFGMFLPMMSMIELTKKQTHCQKNLSDIHKAFAAYCTMNKSRYPHPVRGAAFHGLDVGQDPWDSFPHLKQLQQVGVKAEIFFCPFDASYGNWDAWPLYTWKTPRLQKQWQKPGYDAYIHTGYMNFTYLSYPWMTARFRDGRLPISSSEEDGDVPIMADILHFRNMGYYTGWTHGGGKPDGLWTSSCNTLLNDGSIIHTEAGEFDWNSPAIVVDTVDKWWCAIAE